MKILILTNYDLQLYKYRKELISNLISEGNEIYISLPKGDYIQKLVELGCKFIETEQDSRGVNPFNDLKLLIKYNKIFNKVKPDIVITYTIKPNVYGGIISRIRKKNYISNITGLGTILTHVKAEGGAYGGYYGYYGEK